MNNTPRLSAAGRLAAAFVNSKLTPLFVLASVLLGIFAVVKLPREEEPQIIVPMIDIFVEMPGSSAREVEERVTKPMEKLLWEIPGVEYIYSTSSRGGSMAVVRFLVGQDEAVAAVANAIRRSASDRPRADTNARIGSFPSGANWNGTARERMVGSKSYGFSALTIRALFRKDWPACAALLILT